MISDILSLPRLDPLDKILPPFSGLSPSSSSSLLLDQQHQHHQQVAPAATAAAGATIIQLGQPSAFGPFAASISPSSSSSASASVPHAQHHHFLLGAGEQPAQLQQQSQQLLQHPYSLMGNFSNLVGGFQQIIGNLLAQHCAISTSLSRTRSFTAVLDAQNSRRMELHIHTYKKK